jgi:hypothetical protein
MYIMNKGYKSQYVNCDCDTLFVTVHSFIANHIAGFPKLTGS